MTARDRIVVLVVVAAAVVGAFFMLVLKPKRDEAGRLSGQVASAQERVDTAQAAVQAGLQARTRYAANYATVARLGKAVPTDDDIPSLVFQLDSTAESTGVDFRSVKLTSGAGTATQAPQNAAAAAASTSDQASQSGESKDGEKKDGESKDGSTPANSSAEATGTAASPAQATQTATAALPPGAVVGEAGLSKMPFSFSFEGSFFKLSQFLTRIERYIKPGRGDVSVNGRLLLVDGIALNAAQEGFPSMKASIAASAYLLPATQGLYDGASPQGPSAATPAPPAQPVSDGSSGGSPTTPPATVTP